MKIEECFEILIVLMSDVFKELRDLLKNWRGGFKKVEKGSFNKLV